jgi:imidazoleglycerol-phosphate dehydratase
MSRTATVKRKTTETQVELALDLDGAGLAKIDTGVGFFDHMLTLLARHGALDLTIKAKGDLHVDAHHTVEDVGICFGQAVKEALADKSGIRRYGHFTLPMEETLATTAIDLSGRYFLVFQAQFLHILAHYGRNSHHIAEAIFKATARALRMAVEIDPRTKGVPSTKGTLTS